MFGKPGKHLSATGRDDTPFNQPEPLSQNADEAGRREPGRRPYEEIQNLRESPGNIEALRDSEARFRAIFENAAVGIAHVAPDGRWLEVNQRFCDIVGYDREELMTKTFGDITHPDDLEADWNQARRLLVGEIENYSMEKRYYRKDGSVVWINLTVSIARKADGSPDYFISVVEDISARKMSEENLRQSERRFARFMRHLPGLAWIKDSQGRYVYANAAAVKAFRTPLEELYGRTDDEIFPPEVAAQFKENDQRALTNEAGVFVVETLEHEDGVLHYSAVRKFPIPGQDGSGTNIGGIAIDITESKDADEALRESKERLAGIVSSAMDAIITVDEDHRVVLFNEAAERMFGCPAAEALGQPLNRFIPERFRGAHTEHVRRFGETGGTSRAMGRLRALAALRADGAEFPIEAAISSIEVGGRRLYTVIHRDITERKQAEAEREQLAREQVARAAAEAANRSKDEFLAMVSHELRSPLNAILGYTRMLRSNPADRDAVNNVTAVVERSAKAQLQIIEDLLDSARIVTGKLRIEPGPVDLVPALEAALDTVRPAAEAKGVTLVADCRCGSDSGRRADGLRAERRQAARAPGRVSHACRQAGRSGRAGSRHRQPGDQARLGARAGIITLQIRAKLSVHLQA
jgi:PAS domain S-box-containing protein